MHHLSPLMTSLFVQLWKRPNSLISSNGVMSSGHKARQIASNGCFFQLIINDRKVTNKLWYFAKKVITRCRATSFHLEPTPFDDCLFAILLNNHFLDCSPAFGWPTPAPAPIWTQNNKDKRQKQFIFFIFICYFFTSKQKERKMAK